MLPLFSSSEPVQLPPHLGWHVPERAADYAGKPLMLAGKPIALWTHRVGRRTWPCLNQWPNLGVECPHCDRTRRTTCWVPVLCVHPPRRILCIMGGETTYESIKPHKVGTIVEFHYARVIRSTIVFKRETTQLGQLIHKQLMAEEVPASGDITRWLLHYWQWPYLTALYGEQHRDSINVRMRREKADSHGMETFGKNKGFEGP